MKTRIFIAALAISIFTLNASAQETEYFFSKKLDVSHEKAIEKLKVALKDQGFGVVSETAMHETILMSSCQSIAESGLNFIEAY